MNCSYFTEGKVLTIHSFTNKGVSPATRPNVRPVQSPVHASQVCRGAVGSDPGPR